MRAFSWLTVFVAALVPTAVVAGVVLRADPTGRMMQLIASTVQGDWLLVGALAIAVIPWPVIGIAMIERDRRRQSSAAGSGSGG